MMAAIPIGSIWKRRQYYPRNDTHRLVKQRKMRYRCSRWWIPTRPRILGSSCIRYADGSPLNNVFLTTHRFTDRMCLTFVFDNGVIKSIFTTLLFMLFIYFFVCTYCVSLHFRRVRCKTIQTLNITKWIDTNMQHYLQKFY